MAGRDPKTPDGVILTNKIRENGRKKLLVVGKTGTGKSSLCNVITGHAYDSDIFPVSAEAVSCTQSTQFAEVFFNNNKGRPVSLIDTIGFDDPLNDTDAKIIAELVHELKTNCDYVNLFMIAVNGQNPRLDGALMGMIRIFEGMFGEEFWKQAVIVFTRLPMDKKVREKRAKTTKQTDDELARKYLKVVEAEFPKGQGLQYLFMDACYDEADPDEQVAFDGAMEKLWESLNRAPPLPTTKVQMVETESKKLKNAIAAKERENKMIREQFAAAEKAWKEEMIRFEKQREADREEAAKEKERFQTWMKNEKQKIENLKTKIDQKQTENEKRIEEQKKKIEIEANAEKKEIEEKILAKMEQELKEQANKLQKEKEAYEREMKEKERVHYEENRERERKYNDEKAALETKQQQELEELQKLPGFFSALGRGIVAGVTLGMSEVAGLGKKLFG